MAASLSTQLEGLRRERERLEQLLMLDANWRALRQLEEREAAGQPVLAVDGAGLRLSLEKALAANRIYVARAKLIETIELLSADFPARVPGADNGPLSSRIVMLSEPEGDTFRARLRLKVEPRASSVKVAESVPVTAKGQVAHDEPVLARLSSRLKGETEVAAEAWVPLAGVVPVQPLMPVPMPAPAFPDPLELIDGLSRHAVELLIDGGVTKFSDIADWSSVDVATWRARLDGVTQGSAGWWIEQAALLASGRVTRFAERARRGEFAALVAQPQPEPPRPWMPGAVAADAPTSGIMSPGSPEVPTATVGDVVPPTLPACALVARGVTAEELVRVLDQSEALPPPLPVAPSELAGGHGCEIGSGAISDGSRPAAPVYVRPRQGLASGEVGEGEVEVVVAAVAAGPDRPAAKAGERPRTLLRRMKALNQSGRFESDEYAAYRGSVEEASVTILASAEAKPEPGPPASSADRGASRPANRFLKALTGKS
jgi:predicted flap endonuclease-1-like 5' DNA nuclease